ncbi:MAG: Uma2 family endonuclease [Bryobacteraceae bacterium]
MASTTSVAIEQYLSTVYEPEMDYVDGELEDRNVGEKDHSKLQAKLIRLLPATLAVFPEVRIRVSASRFRVPDVCIYLQEPDEQVFTSPPLAVVEILSPEDRMVRMQRKLEDYYAMGCRNVWILDPRGRKAYRYDGSAVAEVQGSLDAGEVTLPLEKLFD